MSVAKRAVPPGTERPGRSGARRPLGALAAGLLVLALGACDGPPSLPGSRADSESPAASAAPMDPEQLATAATTPVDPSWLCSPGAGEPPVRSTEPGVMTPGTVETDGNDVLVTGAFALGEEHSFSGFVPEGVVLPASAENRGLPVQGFEGALGVVGASTPPMVVRERVEVPGDGTAPSAVTARLTLGTCDDAPLPDGQYLLRLSGGGIDGPGRGADDAGWSASEDVLLDVVDGGLRPVPGAATAPTAPTGEIPADLSTLACRAPLAARGDGDGLAVTVGDPSTSVSTAIPDSELGTGVTAQVTVTSQDVGTRALLQGIVVTNPATGSVVAGARSAADVGLQWVDAEGVSRPETAWITHGGCFSSALSPGTYRAHGFAVTVDDQGATHVVLSEAWDVEVTAEEPTG